MRLLKFAIMILIFTGLFITLSAEEGTAEKSLKAKKKIIFVKDDDGEFFKAVGDLIYSLFEKRGYTKENSEYTVLSLEGNAPNTGEKLAKKIIDMKPDVLLVNGVYIKEFIMHLKGSQVPVIIGINIDYEENGKPIFIDGNKNAVSNINGLYTMPDSYYLNSLKLLQKVAPLKKGKKAVMIEGVFNKRLFTAAFEKLNIPLKAYEKPKYWEDVQELVKKYNEDPEVGWLIVDNAFPKKDGTQNTQEGGHRWIAENTKKPGVAFYQGGVEKGQLCALAIDSMNTVNQMVDMGVRVLKGEKIEKIKPEYPSKTYVLINQKKAKNLGIDIPVDVLKSAMRIYTDYDGHFEGEK